jgi:(p)ppGpp synthase/HD superfamily hydrolase
MILGDYPLTERFAEAFAFAHERHASRRHFRKGTTIPYVAHLIGVTSLVLEHGGDETEGIAALLHDVVEDTPTTLAEVTERFGVDVGAIVDICTDSHGDGEKPPWRPRKERYILRVASAPLAARRVISADKLHNAQAIVRDHETLGDALWGRFNAGSQDIAWYYRTVLQALTAPGDLPAPFVRLLRSTIEDLARRAEG